MILCKKYAKQWKFKLKQLNLKYLAYFESDSSPELMFEITKFFSHVYTETNLL